MISKREYIFLFTFGQEEIYNAKATLLASFSLHLPLASFAWIGSVFRNKPAAWGLATSPRFP